MLSGASQRKIPETTVRATRRFLEINLAKRQLSLEGGREKEREARMRMTGRSERLRGKRTVRSRRAARAPPDPLLEILYISPRGIRTLRCTALSPRNFLSVAFLNGDARSPFTRATRGNSQESLHFSQKNAFRVVRAARSRVTNVRHP